MGHLPPQKTFYESEGPDKARENRWRLHQEALKDASTKADASAKANHGRRVSLSSSGNRLHSSWGDRLYEQAITQAFYDEPQKDMPLVDVKGDIVSTEPTPKPAKPKHAAAEQPAKPQKEPAAPKQAKPAAERPAKPRKEPAPKPAAAPKPQPVKHTARIATGGPKHAEANPRLKGDRLAFWQAWSNFCKVHHLTVDVFAQVLSTWKEKPYTRNILAGINQRLRTDGNMYSWVWTDLQSSPASFHEALKSCDVGASLDEVKKLAALIPPAMKEYDEYGVLSKTSGYSR